MILDVVVIGGGITGLGIARLAARNGYRCALIERGDLASGASSSSSHMLHGGLRYLKHGRLGLVREALAERGAVSRMAPALARPVRFMVPLYRGDTLSPWTLRAGLFLYQRLAGQAGYAPYAMARGTEAARLEPGLATTGLRGAGLYTDVVMDDARLAVAVAADASAHGASIHTYVEALAARPHEAGGIEVEAADRLDGGTRTFHARVVVNATGPWSDRLRALLFRSLHPGRPNPTPLLRPSRGVHLLYPRLTERHGLLVVARADGRVFFVVPFGAHALVGTTEVEVVSPPEPEDLLPTVDEVRYLRRELARALPATAGLPPLAVTSGLRPLLRSDESVGEASREHGVVDEEGIITVAGGKYTTFRVMARDALTQVARRLGREGRPIVDSTDPLPALPPPETGMERQVEYAVTHGFARRVEDVVRRRGTWWLDADRGRVAASRIANVMARMLGWSPERMRAEFQRYDAALWDEQTLLQRAREDA